MIKSLLPQVNLAHSRHVFMKNFDREMSPGRKGVMVNFFYSIFPFLQFFPFLNIQFFF
jgi:hypothetical protein